MIDAQEIPMAQNFFPRVDKGKVKGKPHPFITG